MRKTGRLKVQIASKLPGSETRVQRRVGTRCAAERNRSNPGQWIIWFGRHYATVDAVELHNVIEFDTPFTV